MKVQLKIQTDDGSQWSFQVEETVAETFEDRVARYDPFHVHPFFEFETVAGEMVCVQVANVSVLVLGAPEE